MGVLRFLYHHLPGLGLKPKAVFNASSFPLSRSQGARQAHPGVGGGGIIGKYLQNK